MKRNLLELGLTAAVLAAAFVLALVAGRETISVRDTRRELAP